MREWNGVGLGMLAILLLLGCGGGENDQPVQPTTPAPAPTAVTPAPAPPADAPGGIAAGASVAAPWSGAGNLYLAVVQSVAGSQVTVHYVDDQTTGTVTLAEVRPVVIKPWNVGDKVIAVWRSGRFYPGTIQAKKSETLYAVAWEDGSTPSDVENGKLIAR